MGDGGRLQTDSSENTMEFINRVVNDRGGEDKKVPDNRMADKFDDFNFNFPSLPAYEGIQSNLMLNGQHSSYHNAGGPTLLKKDTF